MTRERAIMRVLDSKKQVTMAWYGGHGVHAYHSGKEIGFWNTGDFSQDNASRKDIRQSMKHMLKKGNYWDYG